MIEDFPAFPYSFPDVINGADECVGMGLRDFFAAHALPALITRAMTEGQWSPTRIARDCYVLADALLAMRSGTPPAEAEAIPDDVRTSKGGLALT
jgi:hypothetical protein